MSSMKRMLVVLIQVAIGFQTKRTAIALRIKRTYQRKDSKKTKTKNKKSAFLWIKKLKSPK
jgi:hypothetical protein